MIRLLSRLFSALKASGRSYSSTSPATATEDEGVGPVDPLDPLKRDEDMPGADPVVSPVPPEV